MLNVTELINRLGYVLEQWEELPMHSCLGVFTDIYYRIKKKDQSHLYV